MKIKYILISVLLVIQISLFSKVKSKDDNTLPASERTAKITSNWIDRTKLTGQSVKPNGQNVLWYRKISGI